jgi:hypothetical protein
MQTNKPISSTPVNPRGSRAQRADDAKAEEEGQELLRGSSRDCGLYLPWPADADRLSIPAGLTGGCSQGTAGWPRNHGQNKKRRSTLAFFYSFIRFVGSTESDGTRAATTTSRQEQLDA